MTFLLRWCFPPSPNYVYLLKNCCYHVLSKCKTCTFWTQSILRKILIFRQNSMSAFNIMIHLKHEPPFALHGKVSTLSFPSMVWKLQLPVSPTSISSWTFPSLPNTFSWLKPPISLNPLQIISIRSYFDTGFFLSCLPYFNIMFESQWTHIYIAATFLFHNLNSRAGGCCCCCC